jgi:RNA polymerase sigma factor (sigma-70 family)
VHDQTDSQLLRAYAEHGAEPAFVELVRRHVDLVYSAALRMVCDSHLAEDVTQSVFVALAKNAAQLSDRAVLSGWLHRTAQNIAAQTVRTDVRRRAREQEAAVMIELRVAESNAVWQQVAPHLDAVLGELSEPDRDAVLLRYFQRQSAREMARTLGISVEAAQKRVSRAIERLREFLAKRGVTTGASGLVVVISTNAVQAAPAGLAITISTAVALAGTTLATTATVTATKAIAMTTLQKIIIGATFVAAIGAGIFETHQASQLREQNQLLQREQAPFAAEVLQLQRERDAATNRLASLLAENEQLRSNPNTTELLKLRREVARLRADAQQLAQSKAQKTSDPLEAAAKDLLGKEELLKKNLEQMPDRNIPELQYLRADIWARVAQTARLDTDAGVREALSQLRDIAKQTAAPRMGKALQQYVQANNGELPSEVSQLKPYFETPVDEALLARYEMIKTGKMADLQPGEMVVGEKAPVDDDYDSLQQIGLNGRKSIGVGKHAGNNSGGSWSFSAPQTPVVGK